MAQLPPNWAEDDGAQFVLGWRRAGFRFAPWAAIRFSPRAKSSVGNWRFESRQDGGSPCGGAGRAANIAAGGATVAIPAQRQRARCALSQCGASGGRALPFRPRPLPREGARGVREAAREDARPPGGALLFVPIVCGIRAEDPAAFLGRAFKMKSNY